MTDKKRLIFLGCMAGFVVFLVLGAITSTWYDNRERLLEEQTEKTRQAEQERIQAESQAEKAKVKAEMDTLKIHCDELRDKVDADPRNGMLDSELSGAGREEVNAERKARHDCYDQYIALLKANPSLVPPPEPVTLDSQRSKALRYRDMASQYLGAAAGDQMYECVVHGFNDPPQPPVTVQGVPPLSAADISACSDLYNRLNSAIERFNRGY